MKPCCPLSTSILFWTLRVVFEEKAEGGKTKQKSLNEPQEAGGRVVDPFVAVEIRERKW